VSRGEMIGRVVSTVGLILKLKIRGEAQALIMTCSSSLLGVMGTITGSFDEDAARNKLDRKAMLAAWFSVRRRSGSDMVRFRERQGLLLSATASFILQNHRAKKKNNSNRSAADHHDCVFISVV